MGYSRRIDSRIQNDERFRSMSWDARNVWFHCFSHPHITTFGAMRCSIPGLCADFKISDKVFNKSFDENLRKGLIMYDPEMLLWFPKYLKHNPPASANVIKSWPKVLDTLPDCPLKPRIILALLSYIATSKYEETIAYQQLVDLKEDLTEDLTEEHAEGHALDPLSDISINKELSSLNPNEGETKNGRVRKLEDLRINESHRETAEKVQKEHPGIHIDLENELAGFNDYCRQKGYPAKQVYDDYSAGFRTRIRNIPKYGTANHTLNKTTSRTQRNLQTLGGWAERKLKEGTNDEE